MASGVSVASGDFPQAVFAAVETARPCALPVPDASEWAMEETYCPWVRPPGHSLVSVGVTGAPASGAGVSRASGLALASGDSLGSGDAESSADGDSAGEAVDEAAGEAVDEAVTTGVAPASVPDGLLSAAGAKETGPVATVPPTAAAATTRPSSLALAAARARALSSTVSPGVGAVVHPCIDPAPAATQGRSGDQPARSSSTCTNVRTAAPVPPFGV